MDRVAERRRAVALALHYREAEGLSIAQIAARLGRSPATVKAYLYDPTGEKARAVKARYLGVGAAAATETDVARLDPLDARAAIRFLREVQRCPSPRDRAIALVPFYAGARIAETVGLDVDDVRLPACKGILRILGTGEKVREIPIHPDLRSALTDWVHERADWPGADTPALFLNQRGGRLSVKGAHDIITTLATAAGLQDDAITAHVLRHIFATRLVRGHTDLVIVAELLGHARLETTRAYSRPTRQDAIDALELLDVDH